jgi:hypothetical protein
MIARGAIDFPPARQNLMRGKNARSTAPAQLNFAFTPTGCSNCSAGLPAREAFRSATRRRYSAVRLNPKTPAGKANFLTAPGLSSARGSRAGEGVLAFASVPRHGGHISYALNPLQV